MQSTSNTKAFIHKEQYGGKKKMKYPMKKKPMKKEMPKKYKLIRHFLQTNKKQTLLFHSINLFVSSLYQFP